MYHNSAKLVCTLFTLSIFSSYAADNTLTIDRAIYDIKKNCLFNPNKKSALTIIDKICAGSMLEMHVKDCLLAEQRLGKDYKGIKFTYNRTEQRNSHTSISTTIAMDCSEISIKQLNTLKK